MNDKIIYAINDEQMHRDGMAFSVFNPTDYGYNNYEEYYNDKILFQLQNTPIKLYDKPLENADELITQAIINKHYSLWISNIENTSVWHGNDYLNYNLCNQLNLRVYEMGYPGGTMIGGKDELCIALIIPSSIDVTFEFFLNKWLELLKSKHLNASIEGNDILVDGKKVMGAMERRFGDSALFGWFISFTDYSNLIQFLCNKTSSKIPSFLDKNKISRDEMIREVKSWVF